MSQQPTDGRDQATSAPAARTSVYVVTYWQGGGNDRVKKLLRLRAQFDKLVLVTPGESDIDDGENLVVHPFPNPTGLLRIAGFTRVKQWMDRYLYYPSVHVLFVERAKRRLARRIAEDLSQGRSVTLLTTAPPHALGMLGLYVKRRFPQIRWVIDWQDLWTYDENYFGLVPDVYRSRVCRLERRMLDTADLNVTTNARAMRVLQDHYHVDPSRLGYIHHHFDRHDFEGEVRSSAQVRTLSGKRVIRIGFLGTLFKPPRVPGLQMVEAIESYRQSGIDVELHVHGHVSPEIRGRLAGYSGVHFHGRVTHRESISHLSSYDYLLVLLSDLANCRAVMSIKLPHYMIAERPILAVVPERSAIADMINATGTGFVIPVEDDWRTELRRILEDVVPESASRKRDEEAIEGYSWESLSRRWIEVLDAEQPAGPYAAECRNASWK